MEWNTLPNCNYFEKHIFTKKYKYSNIITPCRIALKRYNNFLIELSTNNSKDFFGVTILEMINPNDMDSECEDIFHFSNTDVHLCINEINKLIK